MNHVQLSGCLGDAPDTRIMPGGTSVVKFSVATSERWKDKQSGEIKTSTEWHRCFAYGKLGENIAQYFDKGDGIIVTSGKIKTRKYEKNGETRYATEIEVDAFEFPPGARRKQAVPEQSPPNQSKADGAASEVPSVEGRTRPPHETPDASFQRQNDEPPTF